MNWKGKVRRLFRRNRFLNLLLVVKDDFNIHNLRGKKPLHSNPLFIIGSGRSGNTLLRAVIVAQGVYSIPPESFVLGAVIREYKRLSYLSWDVLSRIVMSRFLRHPRFNLWDLDVGEFMNNVRDIPYDKRNLANLIDMFYRYYAKCKHPEASRWGDKTPWNVFYLQEIREVFPKAKYIHMIRDGRDVVSSYIKWGLYDTIKEAANRWIESIKRVMKHKKKVKAEQYKEIRYESLVSKPKSALREVCSFLDIDYSEDILRFYTKSDDLGDTVLDRHTRVSMPVDTSSIGIWNTRLSPLQRKKVETLLDSTLKALNYEM